MVVIREGGKFRNHARLALLSAGTCILVGGLGYLLRRLNIEVNAFLWASSDIIAALLSLTLAANVLVRFYGSGERVSLLLGLGFGLTGFIHVLGIPELFRHFSTAAAQFRVPLSWMVSRTLLATLLLAAFPLESWLRWPREPKRTILAALSIAGGGLALIAAIFLAFPHEPPIYPGSAVPRPWDLLPATIFVAAAAVLSHHIYRHRSAFDASLVWIAGMNAAGDLIASQSTHLLDAPATAGQILAIGSYGVLLGATLLDNARLFGQARHRATTDSLTGLANYGRFVDVLQGEIERSGRTNRRFSILLMDLDKLKEINDQYGHLTGSRALCRVAEILRLHCRSIDTAARYGGDEFALILPETGETAAQHVAARVRMRLESDVELPHLSMSIGIATYPQNGDSVHHLLNAADQQLYATKTRRTSRRSKPRPL